MHIEAINNYIWCIFFALCLKPSLMQQTQNALQSRVLQKIKYDPQSEDCNKGALGWNKEYLLGGRNEIKYSDHKYLLH